MHIVDRRLNPRGKSLANRQRFLRRAKALMRQAVHENSSSRSIKRRRAGRRGHASPPTACANPRSAARPRAACATTCCPATRSYVEGDTIPRPQGGAGGHGQRGQPGRRRRGRVPLRAHRARSSSSSSSRISNCRTSPSARVAEHREPGVAARRLFGRRARPPTSRWRARCATASSRRIALQAPEGGLRSQALAEEIWALEASGDDPRAAREAARGAGAADAAQPAHPLYRPDRRALPPLRGRAEADRPGGDVLPDGRVRLDDRAHEGPRQAVLHAALHLPDAAGTGTSTSCSSATPHQAAEVDEETFFHSPETGGTVVSTALDEMMRVVAERYKSEDWNIYAAQASDGDNTSSDNDRTAAL